MDLNYTQRNPPSGLTAGGFYYLIEWLLNPVAKGIIVQEMHWSFDVRYCSTGEKWSDERIKTQLGMPNFFDDWFNYWERWSVSTNPNRIDPVPTDQISLVHPDPLFPLTFGSIIVNATAHFYENIQAPPEFRQRGGLAGRLASVLTKCPRLPKPDAGPIIRNITVSWNCVDATQGHSKIQLSNPPLLVFG